MTGLCPQPMKALFRPLARAPVMMGRRAGVFSSLLYCFQIVACCELNKVVYKTISFNTHTAKLVFLVILSSYPRLKGISFHQGVGVYAFISFLAV